MVGVRNGLVSFFQALVVVVCFSDDYVSCVHLVNFILLYFILFSVATDMVLNGA